MHVNPERERAFTGPTLSVLVKASTLNVLIASGPNKTFCRQSYSKKKVNKIPIPNIHPKTIS
jgi:hypothetical protein